MAPRSGARPMPPATMTTSLSSNPSTPQSVPNGPRTPTTDPTAAVQREWVMAPTSRTVCSTGPGAPGALLIEIATSPTPKDVSMLNWPGLNENGLGPDVGSSDKVTTSPVSTCLATTR